MVYVFDSEKDLRSTSTDLLEKGIFKNVQIFDSSGQVFLIREAFKVGYKGFFGLSLIKKGRQILVDLNLNIKRKYH